MCEGTSVAPAPIPENNHPYVLKRPCPWAPGTLCGAYGWGGYFPGVLKEKTGYTMERDTYDKVDVFAKRQNWDGKVKSAKCKACES
jgi:hypothetical protein